MLLPLFSSSERSQCVLPISKASEHNGDRGTKQLGEWLGGGTEGALLGKVSGARHAGGQPCQLSLCVSERKRGKEEATASEQIQREAAGASEPWLICASCEPLLPSQRANHFAGVGKKEPLDVCLWLMGLEDGGVDQTHSNPLT